MIIALIPARQGSMRVPKKNLRLLAERPLITYAVQVGLESDEIDRVIVSTDSKEIASVAQEAGAEVPFLRPENLAGADSGDRGVILHALDWLENEEAIVPECVFYMRPTSPLRRSRSVDQAIRMLRTNKTWTGLRSVSAVSGVHHPFWMFREEKGRLLPFIEGISVEEFYQSQLLPPCFRLNGCIDIARASVVRESESIYGESPGSFQMKGYEALDIDTLEDFDYCEWVMRKQTSDES